VAVTRIYKAEGSLGIPENYVIMQIKRLKLED
jgi:hypothetical protein